jgi:hypothetical protein
MSVANPIIDYIDGTTRRIYLLSGVSDYFPIEDIYHEYRNRRRLDADELRKYNPLLRAEGNVPKGAGAFTPRFVVLLEGTKIVPFNESLQINQLGDMITDNPDVDPSLYDISGLTAAKPIFIKPSEAETIQLNSSSIEYSSFGGGVTIDSLNGTNGTGFPQGTPRSPVRTVADAVTIAEFRGFNRLFVRGNLTLDTGDILSGYALEGNGVNRTNITVLPGAVVDNVEIQRSTVGGTFDGKTSFKDSTLLDINFVEAEILNCTLKGTIILEGNGTTNIEDSRDGLLASLSSPVIDFNNTSHNLGIRGYNGDINFKNKSGLGDVEINMNSGGRVILESTVSAGKIRLTGALELQNNSTGTAEIDDSQVIYPEYQQLVSFNQGVQVDSINGVSGTKFPIGTSQNPVNNIDDAILIAEKRSISTLRVTGTLVVIGKNLDNYTLEGTELTAVVVLIPNTGNSNNKTTFRNIGLTGQLNGYIYADSAAIIELSNIGSDTFPTIFSNCIIRADNVSSAIGLNGSLIAGQDVHFFDCTSAALDGEVITVDFNGSNSAVGFRRFSGELIVKNYTSGQDSVFSLAEGRVVFDSTNTSGSVQFKGNGVLVDNSNGLVISSEEAAQKYVADSVWNKQIP